MPSRRDRGAGTLRADGPPAPPFGPSFGEPAAEPTAEPTEDLGGQRAPSRWRRARKVILIVAAVIVVVAAGTASAAYLVTNHYLNSMKRIHDPFASIPAAQRPPRPSGAAA